MANVPVLYPEIPPVDINGFAQYASLVHRQLEAVHEALLAHQQRVNIDTVLTVNNQPQTLTRNGRRHTLLWVASTVSCQIDNLVGFGVFTLFAGWNVVDLAENARIITSSVGAPTFNALYRCTDFEISGAVI